MGSALENLRVADFSRVLAGPFATMLLADLGAEVTKVERPGGGDETRAWGPPFDERGEATYFQSVNRNKRSVVLDLADPADQARARELALDADVLVENFRPGVMDRLGLGYEQLRAENPALVYCSITGFGRGAGAVVPGYDLLVQAVSGLMSITGSPDGPPYRSGISLFDVMTGLHSAIGILAAVHHRDETGEGQHVETALLSSALSAMVNQTSAYIAGGVTPRRMGNAHLSLFPYEPLPTGDGELIVAAGNDGQFRRLCEAIGAPELADDPRFATSGDRNVRREELKPLLLERLAARSAAEWFPVLTKAGVPCGPINDVSQGVALAADLGLAPVADAGGIPTARNPITLSATPARYDLAPPALGADSASVRAWLGFGSQEGE